MREIKFRGKAKKDCNYKEIINNEFVDIKKGDFVYGSLIEKNSNYYIYKRISTVTYDYTVIDVEIEVIPETVGQFTGLYDKNGVEIYEGDILRFSNKWEWYRGSAKNWYTMTPDERITWVEKQPYYEYVVEYEAPEYNLLKSECENYYEVIGNVHEVK